VIFPQTKFTALWLLYYASEEGEAVITGDKE
jgi:hypothetical protein